MAEIQPFLIGNASHVFAKDNEGRSVLFFAVERGNVEILNHLLELPNRPDLSDTDFNGLSLMHYAVRSSRVQTIDVLYDHGCSIRAVDKNNQTALHHAVKRGNLEGIKRLLFLDGSGLLEKMDNRGQTALDLAVYTNEVIVMAHLKSVSTSSSNLTDGLGKSVLHPVHQDAPELHPFSPRWRSGISFRSNFWQFLAILAILAFGARS